MSFYLSTRIQSLMSLSDDDLSARSRWLLFSLFEKESNRFDSRIRGFELLEYGAVFGRFRILVGCENSPALGGRVQMSDRHDDSLMFIVGAKLLSRSSLASGQISVDFHFRGLVCARTSPNQGREAIPPAASEVTSIAQPQP